MISVLHIERTLIIPDSRFLYPLLCSHYSFCGRKGVVKSMPTESDRGSGGVADERNCTSNSHFRFGKNTFSLLKIQIGVEWNGKEPERKRWVRKRKLAPKLQSAVFGILTLFAATRDDEEQRTSKIGTFFASLKAHSRLSHYSYNERHLRRPRYSKPLSVFAGYA